MDPIKQQINELYQKLFTEKLTELNTTHQAKDNEQIAQKFAIKETALKFFSDSPATDKKIIWSYIYRAHVARKSGIDIPPETIEKVKSADQSWIKSGGHAFEEMVKDLANRALENEGITIHLQKDLAQMIHAGKVRNEERDMTFLKTNMNSSAFDLYAEKDGLVFGCIQAKTSIRDRVTRDREPSITAMAHFLWSVVFVLDGDFLRLPKFKEMVKGEGEMFEQNGWHGLYAFSLPDAVICDRIYRLDNEMDIFKQHAVQAFKDWKDKRQWFDHRWHAETHVQE